MDDWRGTIDRLQARALAELEAVDDADALERWRVAYLGRRGALTDVLRGLSGLPADQRPAAGQAANVAKRALEAAFEAREQAAQSLALAQALDRERIDVTLPGRPPTRGGLHPTTIILREITGFFQSLGYQVVEGPEVELDE